MRIDKATMSGICESPEGLFRVRNCPDRVDMRVIELAEPCFDRCRVQAAFTAYCFEKGPDRGTDDRFVDFLSAEMKTGFRAGQLCCRDNCGIGINQSAVHVPDKGI